MFALATGRELGPVPPDDAESTDPEAGAHDGQDEQQEQDEHDGQDEPPDDEPPPAHVGHLKMPFGPMLALGSLEYLFFGERVIAWWFGLLGGI